MYAAVDYDGPLAQTRPLLRWLQVYRVVLDELLNETGHGSPIVVSKYRIVID